MKEPQNEKTQEDTAVLRDIGESPKEQRTPGVRVKRPEEKEEEPPEGGRKRLRLKQALTPAPLDAMELASGGEGSLTSRDGE